MIKDRTSLNPIAVQYFIKYGSLKCNIMIKTSPTKKKNSVSKLKFNGFLQIKMLFELCDL